MKTINTYYEDQPGFIEFVRNHQHMFSQENTSILVQVFCGRNEPEYLKKLAAEISAELPMANIVGTTTFGEIMNGEVSGLRTVLSIAVFQKTTLRASSFHKGDLDDLSLGRHIAATLGSDKAKVLILFGAGDSIKADQVLKEIEAEYPQLLVAGGSAGNNFTLNPALVFYNQDVIDCGFIGLVLEGEDLDVCLYSHLGWQPIGKEMTISEVKGSRVYTINSIPAYQVYRRYLGIDKTRNFLNAVEFPLILNRNGFLMARTPMAYYEDDSIGFAGEFVEGEKVRLSFGDAGLISEMIEQLCWKIQQRYAESIFVYSCESRRGFLQDLSNIETQPLQKLAPTSGFFTAGEYFHYKGANHRLNATMTVLVLSESKESLQEREDYSQEKNSCLPAVCPSSPDSVAERSTGVLKALTHLINTVTAELEVANQDLQYIGMHDSLTGTYNRNYFEQEMTRLEKQDNSVGIIICDIDYLKIVNDTLGHEFGDRMIRLLANIMLKSCRKEDVVARIGGDEFVVLARGATEADLAGISARMEASAQNARALHNDNLIYFSVGFAQREKDSALSLSEVFTAADNAMYKYKIKYKEQVQKDIMQRIAQMNRKAVDGV